MQLKDENENLVGGIFSYDMLRNLLLWARTCEYSEGPEIYEQNKPMVVITVLENLGRKPQAFDISQPLRLASDPVG